VIEEITMEEKEFKELYKNINSIEQKTSDFATEALKDLYYLEANGVIDEFNKLTRPSDRQIFIATNPKFKNFLSNFSLYNFGLSQSVDEYNKLINKLSGSDLVKESAPSTQDQ
jgi:hypothetical protein